MKSFKKFVERRLLEVKQHHQDEFNAFMQDISHPSTSNAFIDWAIDNDYPHLEQLIRRRSIRPTLPTFTPYYNQRQYRNNHLTLEEIWNNVKQEGHDIESLHALSPQLHLRLNSENPQQSWIVMRHTITAFITHIINNLKVTNPELHTRLEHAHERDLNHYPTLKGYVDSQIGFNLANHFIPDRRNEQNPLTISWSRVYDYVNHIVMEFLNQLPKV